MGCWRNFVLGCVLRTAGSSIIWNYADPLTSLELLNYYLTLAMSSNRNIKLVAAFLIFYSVLQIFLFSKNLCYILLQLCLCLESSSLTLCSPRAGTTAWTTNGSGPLLLGGNRYEAGIKPILNRSHSTFIMQQCPRAIILALEISMYSRFFLHLLSG